MDIERAGESPLTLNPVIGISREDLVRAGLSVARELLLQPTIAIRQALGVTTRSLDSFRPILHCAVKCKVE